MSDEMEYLPEWAGPIVERMAEADRLALRIAVSRELMRVDFTRNTPNIGMVLNREESDETMEVGRAVVENCIQDIHKLLKEVEDQARIIHDLREDRDTVYVAEEKDYYGCSNVVGIFWSVPEVIRFAEGRKKRIEASSRLTHILVTVWVGSSGRRLAAFNGAGWVCTECLGKEGRKCLPCDSTGAPSWKEG